MYCTQEKIPKNYFLSYFQESVAALGKKFNSEVVLEKVVKVILLIFIAIVALLTLKISNLEVQPSPYDTPPPSDKKAKPFIVAAVKAVATEKKQVVHMTPTKRKSTLKAAAAEPKLKKEKTPRKKVRISACNLGNSVISSISQKEKPVVANVEGNSASEVEGEDEAPVEAPRRHSARGAAEEARKKFQSAFVEKSDTEPSWEYEYPPELSARISESDDSEKQAAGGEENDGKETPSTKSNDKGKGKSKALGAGNGHESKGAGKIPKKQKVNDSDDQAIKSLKNMGFDNFDSGCSYSAK